MLWLQWIDKQMREMCQGGSPPIGKYIYVVLFHIYTKNLKRVSSLQSGVELKTMTNMTKKLVWRLQESPTSKKLQELVASGILTTDEAREMLFSSETKEDRDKKSLQSEIKFLRELVEKLSNSRSQIVTTIKEIEVPVYRKYPWYEPYTTWCGSDSNIMCGSDSNTINYNNSLMTTTSFSDITTF